VHGKPLKLWKLQWWKMLTDIHALDRIPTHDFSIHLTWYHVYHKLNGHWDQLIKYKAHDLYKLKWCNGLSHGQNKICSNNILILGVIFNKVTMWIRDDTQSENYVQIFIFKGFTECHLLTVMCYKMLLVPLLSETDAGFKKHITIEVCSLLGTILEVNSV
jgi:hypothetical protein